MIKRLLLILVMINLLNQRCLEGCSRCTEDNKCLYCNVNQNYSLEFGRCVEKVFTNCLKINERGKCDLCDTNYYLDNVSLRCVELQENLKVQNCLYHLRPGTCFQCNEKFLKKMAAVLKLQLLLLIVKLRTLEVIV